MKDELTKRIYDILAKEFSEKTMNDLEKHLQDDLENTYISVARQKAYSYIKESLMKDEPAFPIKMTTLEWRDSGMRVPKDRIFGLTKREYFAGLAMQGLCANNIQIDTTDYTKKEPSDELRFVSQSIQPLFDLRTDLALKAVGIADALIKELEGSGSKSKPPNCS